MKQELTHLTEDDYAVIDSMLADQKNMGQVARAIGMSRVHFFEIIKGDERFKEIQERHRDNEELELRSMIWDNIRDARVPYRDKRPDIFFLLKTKHGYRETAKKEELEATVKAVKDEFVGYDISVVPKKKAADE